MQGNTARQIFDNLNKALEAKLRNPCEIVGEAHVFFFRHWEQVVTGFRGWK